MATVAGRKFSRLSGVLFRHFQKGEKFIYKHKLDTNTNKYYEILERIVIPECMSVASNVPGYPERLRELLSYNVKFHAVWNVNVELTYRMVADKAHQTEENITKMYLLRAVTDLVISMETLLDDRSDNTDFRCGERTWHTFCEGGESAAIYDAIQTGLLAYYILQKHFRNDPGYIRMMDFITMGKMKVMIGQTLDILGHGKAVPTMNDFMRLCYYKTGQIMSVGPALALLHSGVSSEGVISKTMKVFSEMGQLLQIWNDFTDYYCSIEETGKPSNDIQYGRTTWVAAKAMENFSPIQAKEYKECYGSNDPTKIERVQALYNEIDMPLLYTEFMIQNYNNCKAMISEIPHQRVREACISYLEWLLEHDDSVTLEKATKSCP